MGSCALRYSRVAPKEGHVDDDNGNTRRRRLSDAQRLRLTAEVALLCARASDAALMAVVRELRLAAGLRGDRRSGGTLDNSHGDVAGVARASG